MIISINGEKVDMAPDTEKTIGQVLAGIEAWLDGPNPHFHGKLRLSGMEIDGQAVNADSLESVFDREIASIKTLNVKVKSTVELYAEALLYAHNSLVEFENLDFAQKQGYDKIWEAGPAAALIGEQSPVLCNEIKKTLQGEGLNTQALALLIDERLREIENPAEELSRIGTLVTACVSRLEDLPLDMQTGKDKRASETVQLFSSIAEKIFRIYFLLDTQGLLADEIKNEIKIEGFSEALKEMLSAYENKDTVLVGDMAEYELAPRLRDLYAALSAPNGAI